MDKKSKQRRQKTATNDELNDAAAPRGASFDTAEGRAAQGMRADIGRGGAAGEAVGESAAAAAAAGPGDQGAGHSSQPEIEGAVGASDADNGGGRGAGIPDADTAMRTDGRVNKGDVEADRRKIFPEAKTKRGK